MNTIESLFSSYLAGDVTPDERAQLEAWLAESPENARTFASVRALWAEAQPLPVPSPEAFLGRLEAAIRQDEAGAARVTSTASVAAAAAPSRRIFRQSSRSPVRWIGTAAVATAVLVAGGWWTWSADRVRPETGQHGSVIVAQRGERTQADLPDGSSVLLGPGSTARYAKGFGWSHRTITIEGQALFTVTHQGGAPFVVQTRDAETRVLGTTFSVRQYADDSETQVVVAAGKVAVASPKEDMRTLASGEAADVSAQGAVETYRVSDMAAALAWSHGRLDYSGTPLAQVVADVNRLYDVDIVLESPGLGAQRFSGIVDQQSTSNAIAMIAATAGLEIGRRGNTFILRGLKTP